MALIKSIKVRNFRCFRQLPQIEMKQATYLIGINNSGKTALLSAIHCFFDSDAFKSEYLNKTEFAAKKEGYNRSDITLEFDLYQVTGKTRKRRMQEQYGTTLTIRKSFTFREISQTIVVQYNINGGIFEFDGLDEDIRRMLSAVAISYIHPQEGNLLLAQAQEKFKARLFNNWGRHVSVSEHLRELQDQWDKLRKITNTYLSTTLTSNLKEIWPHSTTKVDLPEKIEDIVAVSEISFRSSPTLPEVSLTSQGTGAQSTILYQTHYILDSDRSLHRGIYFPVWLLEEPESFLHANINVKLSNLLNSDEWLESIQMIISTHSPIVLAASRQNASRTQWVLFRDHSVMFQKPASKVTDEDIQQIADLMGDANFDAYFIAAQNRNLVFIEDTRELTKKKYEEAGIPVTSALRGTSAVKKHLAVFSALPQIIRKKAYFIIDNDKGAKEFGKYCTEENRIREENGFSVCRVTVNVFILLLPENTAVENLFDEFDDFLDECIKDIYDDTLNFKDSVPTNLSRAVSALRRKTHPTTIDEAKELIKNEQDVKDIFWVKVEESGYVLAQSSQQTIKSLLGIIDEPNNALEATTDSTPSMSPVGPHR